MNRTEERIRDVSYVEDTTDSIYQLAHKRGITLQQWVAESPQNVLRQAQACVAAWESLSSYGAMTGRIPVTNEDGETNFYKMTREQGILIDKSMSNARNDLQLVEMMLATGNPEDMAKDRLIKTLYNKALSGDIRAIQYFIDRVDGRISDQKSEELDHGNAAYVYMILHTLFDKQLDVLNSGPGTKIACCSRRAGKTHMIAATLLIDALRTTNTTCIYIGETMQLADGLLNSAMNVIVDVCKLKDSQGKKLNWRKLENGSQILVRGLSNTKDPDLIRGHKAKTIVIDEFFHLKSDLLEYLQAEVLEPMQLDYAHEYKQILIGTPPKIRGTYGEKVWKELDVPHFKWTAKDNPHIKGFDDFVDEKCREKGIDRSNPYIQREYFGEWAYDEDALLYPEYYCYDVDEAIPQFNIDRIYCGLDYGVSDNNAVIALAWDSELRRGYVFYEIKFNRLTCDRNITMLEQLKNEVKILWEYALDFWPTMDKKEANKKIWWEADSSDQQLTQELKYNVQIKVPARRNINPITNEDYSYDMITMQIGNAHRADKIIMQDKIRDMLRTADLLLPKGGATARECDMTVLKRDAMGNIYPEIDDKTFHPDLLPALRYALWPAVGLETVRRA